MKYQILQGDNRETLKTIADNSIDAIVTDPPYGIDFLGKAWDANTGALETYQECLRVLKPGGHILAFSAARTYHHLAVTLEQAGFEIRDQIMWIYSSGFPKSQDIGRSIQRGLGVEEYEEIIDTTKNSGFGQMDVARTKVGQEWSTKETKVGKAKVTDPEAQKWEGWGTALKPAHEPIALARKPIKGSIAQNCQKWGTGALNIDEARVPNIKGDRFPSNVIGEILQADYQKYFYCPKVSRRERHIGHEMPPAMFGGVQGCYDENGERFAVGFDDRSEGKTKKKKHDPLAHIPTNPDGMWDDGVQFQEKKQNVGNVGNNHPTVKPVELMKYLIKLITPSGGTVLDPFNGSGSTGMAAVELGHPYIGCELDPKYVEIAEKRIEAWLKKDEPKVSAVFEELFE
jgi:site-specific DNA-methyltransferase (adenine-specific)